VVDYLLLNRDFPRAIYHGLSCARESLHSISGTNMGSYKNPAEKLLGQLCSELSYATVDEVIAYGLHEYIDALQEKMNQISSEIYETFFARKAAPLPQRLPMSQFQMQ
jgi:uncharacterized alpha-E superfamily protein